jgi:hypothetical protein
MSQGALGDVLEADIHFDYPDPGWISGWAGKKEYIPGEGMTFALGESHSFLTPPLLFRGVVSWSVGGHVRELLPMQLSSTHHSLPSDRHAHA